MKRLLVFVLLVLLAAMPLSVRASVQDFDIPTFEADYYLSKDKDGVALLAVQEQITAVFPQIDQNHGILRAIPETYDGHSLELEVLSVKNASDKDLTYETYSENDNLVLKIGDADTYVHGEQVYKISYLARGVTLNVGDHDEFFWDVNGDQWQQPMTSVVARVHLSSEIAANLNDETKCFTGEFGAIDQLCDISRSSSENNSAVFTISNNSQLTPLYAGQTLTFLFDFNPQTFAPYKPSDALIATWVSIAAGIILPPIVALVIVIRNWRKYGRDPKGKGVIVPEYLPPKDLTVLESNAVLTERFESKAVTAQIIDLAVRHFLKIYETKEEKFIGHKTDYEVEFTGGTGELTKEEREVLALIFKTQHPTKGDKVKMSSLTSSLAVKVAKLGKDVNANLATKQYFRVAPEKAKLPYVVVGIVLLVAGFVFVPWTIGLILAAVVVLIAGTAMPARTALGVEKRDHLLGLKMYMQLAEAERLKILQSPNGKLTEKINVDDKKQLVKLYERLLSYAMLFGIEKEWAKQFAHLYTEEPSWYHGSSAFNGAIFASSLSGFSTASAASFAPPASSGGGSGGSAGGGGGGGGGGGW